MCRALFGNGSQLRYQGMQDALSSAACEWDLRKIHGLDNLRRECLDHILFHDGRHVQRVGREYIAYFNQERPHQGLGQHIPDRYHLPGSKPTGERIRTRAILGGLHHSYARVTYLN